MPHDKSSCVSTLINVTFYAKMSTESDKSVNECRFIKMNVSFYINEFVVGINENIFLVMNSKRCIKRINVRICSNKSIN